MKPPDLLLVDNPAEIQLPDALTPSLGLLYIASYLRSEGFKVEFLDGYISYLPFNTITTLKNMKKECVNYFFFVDKFIQNIINFKSPIVGFSCSFTSSIFYIYTIVNNLKKKSPDTLIVLGGFHASALPIETLLLIEGADIIVIGEGELTMKEIIEYKRNQHKIDEIKGIAYRKNGRIVKTNPRPLINDLDILPFPDRSLAPISYYNELLRAVDSHERSEGNIISSRGCPNHCIYCCVASIHGRGFRTRSATNVVHEIEIIHEKYQTSYFKFQDDIFSLNKKRTKEICLKLIDLNLDISWGCQTRVDCVDKELLILMRKAGCKYLSFGIESGDPNILLKLKKNINLKQIFYATKVAKNAGLFVNFGLIIGNPEENQVTIQNTIRLIKKLKPNSAGVAIMIPYPGSSLFNSKLGKISLNWRHYRQSGTKIPPFLPEGFTSKSLFSLWKNARKEIYEILGIENKISIIYPKLMDL